MIGAFGAFLIANSKTVLKASFKASMSLLKKPKHDKEGFLELLTLLFAIFKLAQSKGMLTLRDDGADKISRGETTMEEVLRVTQEDTL